MRMAHSEPAPSLTSWLDSLRRGHRPDDAGALGLARSRQRGRRTRAVSQTSRSTNPIVMES